MGVEPDSREAIRWFREAADQGHPDAQNSLGVAYSDGKGVERGDEEAVKWFRAAAVPGDADAAFNLGVMYGGEGV